MSNISTVEAKLPPGFRFHPRDEELICDYLMKKVTNNHHHLQGDLESPLLIEVDLNKSEPWDIPETACVGGKDWYFYSQRDRKYATGLRTNRATATGYWKATGKDRAVLHKGSLVGMRKTLVFYQGRAPRGRKTDWVMHEFRLEGPFGPPKFSSIKEDWVLCRVFYKNKEVSAKSSMESCYEDTSSLSLPALTDSYIYFDSNPTLPNNIDDFEQVPCFSIYSQSQTSPNNMVFSSPFMTTSINNNTNNMDLHQLQNTATMGNGASFAEMGNLDSFSSGKKVIKAVLDQYFTKMENINNGAMKGSSTSLGGGGGEGSSESFLSEVDMVNLF